MSNKETNNSPEIHPPLDQARLKALYDGLGLFARHFGKVENIQDTHSGVESGAIPDLQPQKWSIELKTDELRQLGVTEWDEVHVEFEEEHFDPEWGEEEAWWPPRVHLFFATFFDDEAKAAEIEKIARDKGLTVDAMQHSLDNTLGMELGAMQLTSDEYDIEIRDEQQVGGDGYEAEIRRDITSNNMLTEQDLGRFRPVLETIVRGLGSDQFATLDTEELADMTEQDAERHTSFEVDPRGAYLTQLTDSEGREVLFPLQMIGEKKRGGSHVCLPQFGPDASGALNQHGFGRELEWGAEEDSFVDGVKLVKLELDPETLPEEYEHLRASLQYRSEPDKFSMILNTYNADDTASLRLAPGFHPYFNVDGPVALNGEAIDLSDYGEAQFITGNSHTLQIGDRTLTLESKELTTWAVWTDQKGGYLCVEPTLVGNSFADTEQEASDEELLGPGRMRAYDLTIRWDTAQAATGVE